MGMGARREVQRGFNNIFRPGMKQYSEGGELNYLTSIRPGAAPDSTDEAVQAAARAARVTPGRNRRSTFLTGPGSAEDALVKPRTLLGGR